MKTITFFSYKGGVGRSLAVSKIATRLSQLGQRVCVMDFDLDAPGLRFKFPTYKFFKPVTRGMVDYIYNFSQNKIIDDIQEYAVELTSLNPYFENITFLSAGDIMSNEYWKKLAMIRWYDLFYSENPQGIDFFLDLKAQIIQKINPDFLLIDSRTGITDISGITLKLLADEVVVLAVNNKENLFGARKVIKSLLSTEQSFFNNPPKVSFVLTRVALTKYDAKSNLEVIDYERESILVDSIKNDFKAYLNLEDFDISIIHRDKKIEEEEGQVHGLSYENSPGSVSRDYLSLLEKITENYLDWDEKLLVKKRAELEYVKSWESLKIEDQVKFINNAINLDGNRIEYYMRRGLIFFDRAMFEESIEDFNKALSLSPEDPWPLYNIAVSYVSLNRPENALTFFERVGESNVDAITARAHIYRKMNRLDDSLAAYTNALNKRPSDTYSLNGRADTYRAMKNLNAALADIAQAIQINPDEAILFATLAEIYADSGKIEDFYLNLGISLSKGLGRKALNAAFDVYKRFLTEDRLIQLLRKYNIDITDLTDETLFENYTRN